MADRFDLQRKGAKGGAGGAGRGAAKKPKEAAARKEYTPAEQLDLLKTYVLVPKDFWPELNAGTHIRYYTTEGAGSDPRAFRIGGYIQANPYAWKPKDSPREKRGILLTSSLSTWARGKASTWPVEYKITRDIYVRADPAALLMRAELSAIVGNLHKTIEALVQKARADSARIAALERGRDHRGSAEGHRRSERSRSRHSHRSHGSRD
jgi:hypothetical protein